MSASRISGDPATLVTWKSSHCGRYALMTTPAKPTVSSSTLCDRLQQQRHGVVAGHEVGHVHQPLEPADRDEVLVGHVALTQVIGTRRAGWTRALSAEPCAAHRRAG